MARRRRPKPPTQVESLKHQDTRKNIPTEELRDFAPDEPDDVGKTLRWPRDPALDPQLVWQGKDQLDGEDLEVPVVPVYIQEKLHPHAIMEDLRRATANGTEEQLDWFDDFNGIDDLQRKLEFYEHDQYWQNRLILGDSLLVMASLAEKEGLRGKVQCIYLDPPYGVKFNSNWQVSTRKRDVRDGRVEDATRQPEQVRAFRDTWKLGVHSYLTYLRDRLSVARELLNETGSIFVQIGDENAHRVRAVLDEVFGDENFISNIAFQKTGSLPAMHLPNTHDYLLCYAKNKTVTKWRRVFLNRLSSAHLPRGYDLEESNFYNVTRIEKQNRNSQYYSNNMDRLLQSVSLESAGASLEGSKPVSVDGAVFSPRVGAHWKTTDTGINRLQRSNRIIFSGNSMRYKMRLVDFPITSLSNVWSDVMGATDLNYVIQTNTKVVERCLLMATDPGDLVLDPTCGSGTTAYVAEQWGRRWITIDTSRVALALARTRLMAARYPYYLLADSPEGRARENALTASTEQNRTEQNRTEQNRTEQNDSNSTIRQPARLWRYPPGLRLPARSPRHAARYRPERRDRRTLGALAA